VEWVDRFRVISQGLVEASKIHFALASPGHFFLQFFDVFLGKRAGDKNDAYLWTGMSVSDKINEVVNKYT
jgi:hypothetical protein